MKTFNTNTDQSYFSQKEDHKKRIDIMNRFRNTLFKYALSENQISDLNKNPQKYDNVWCYTARLFSEYTSIIEQKGNNLNKDHFLSFVEKAKIRLPQMIKAKG